MCGRYALTSPPEAVREAFGYREQPNFPPRYNIAPTQPVPVVRQNAGAREFVLMRWGFLPGWVRDPREYPLVINIRGESAREKPSFRAAFMRRRCLMPVDGFYELQRQAGGSRRPSEPWLFRRPDRGVFAFASLWESWHGADGSEIDTVALLTGPANGLMSAIHERCPVILPPEDHARWLAPETSPDEAATLLKPPPEEALEMLAVGSAVNAVAHDGAELQAPRADAAASPATSPAPRPRRPRSTPDDGQGSLF